MFFVVSKVAWWILAPLNALILLQLLGLLLITLRRRRIGVALLAFSTAIMLAVALTPLDDLLLFPLEKQYPRPATLPAKVEGIVVLGGGQNPRKSAFYGFSHMNEDGARVTTLVELARRYPEARLVFSGGSGSLVNKPRMREAEVVQMFFREQGLDAGRLILEDKSRNTHENALYTQALVRPKAGETWLLVTSAYHMPRSVAIFDKLGWKVIPYPSGYRSLPPGSEFPEPDAIGHFHQLEVAVREWIGLAAYRVTGRI